MPGDVSRFEHTVGRYMLFGQIGAGGMASVHIGRRVGAGGFARLVAIKRLHPHLVEDHGLVKAFLDEARMAARVSHPNVVSIDDVVMDGDEVLLVMEYVAGRSLAQLVGAEARQGRAVPPPIAGALALDILRGLQAAHTARDERGRELGLIHRDVSPQNVLVGTDGVARVLDFGIAKALGRLETTAPGAIKGKLSYMAPERLKPGEATTSVDIYGAAIVVWEILAGARYFDGPADETMLPRVIFATYRHLEDPALAKVDAVLERALRRRPEERHKSASELAAALEDVLEIASRDAVIAWVQRVAGPELAAAAEAIEAIEQTSVPSPAPTSKKSTSQAIEPPAHTNAPVITRAPPIDPPALRASRAWIAVVALLAGGLVAAISLGGFAASRSESAHAAPVSAVPAAIAPVTDTTPVVSPANPVPDTPALAPASSTPPRSVRPGTALKRAPVATVTSHVDAKPAAAPVGPPAAEPEAPTDRK
jgi:eukaryotic-like serine/threonine-protein kinase